MWRDMRLAEIEPSSKELARLSSAPNMAGHPALVEQRGLRTATLKTAHVLSPRVLSPRVLSPRVLSPRVLSPIVSPVPRDGTRDAGRFDRPFVDSTAPSLVEASRGVVSLADEGPALRSAARALRQDGYRTLSFAGAETAFFGLPQVAGVTSVVVLAEHLRIRSGASLVDALAGVRPSCPTVLVGSGPSACDGRIVARVASGDDEALRRAVARAVAEGRR
jgi:hypothetical protein